MRAVRTLKYAAFVVLGGALLFSVAELQWWRNARDTYPRFLIGTPPAAATSLEALRQECGEPLETYRKGSSEALIRCGHWWPNRSVWLVPVAHVGSDV